VSAGSMPSTAGDLTMTERPCGRRKNRYIPRKIPLG
jgi:hypothetical protein